VYKDFFQKMVLFSTEKNENARINVYATCYFGRRKRSLIAVLHSTIMLVMSCPDCCVWLTIFFTA